MEIFCRVTENGLVPMYDSDLEERKRLKLGSDVLCKITKPRNYEFHKKYIALLRLTVDNLPEHLHEYYGVYSLEDMMMLVKLDLGLSTIKMIGGREHIIEGSISFAAMDDTQLEVFFKREVDLVLHKYMKGTENQASLDEIERVK